jgi:HAUS augmin-like complex subunit 2
MLRPVAVALASCTRYFEAMSATRESLAELQKLRVGKVDSSLPMTPDSSQLLPGVSDCLTSLPSE